MSYLPTSLRERRPHSILPENSQVKEAQDEKWQMAMAKEEQGECHLFTLNLKSRIKAMANFLKGKSSAKYQ